MTARGPDPEPSQDELIEARAIELANERVQEALDAGLEVVRQAYEGRIADLERRVAGLKARLWHPDESATDPAGGRLTKKTERQRLEDLEILAGAVYELGLDDEHIVPEGDFPIVEFRVDREAWVAFIEAAERAGLRW